MSSMIDAVPLIKANHRTGLSGSCLDRRLAVPTNQRGAPSHDVGEAVVAKPGPLVSQTVLSHAQTRRVISLGES
jgi:hypothetical protein